MENKITKISEVTPMVTFFLRNLGLSNYYIIKIFDLAHDAAIALTEDDPFWLLEEFPRMGFRKVDEIAEALGKEKDSPERVRAAISFVLNYYISEGHSYAPLEELRYRVSELIELPSDTVKDVMEDMTFEGKIHIASLDGERVVYFYHYFKAECDIAKMLTEMSQERAKEVSLSNLDFEIKKCESLFNVRFTDEQKTAIFSAISENVSIITGGPGTGKTTVLSSIITILEDAGLKVKLACPTGRASKRAMEATKHFASTIHRLLEAYFDESIGAMRFARNEENKLDCDAVIIDESSMLDLLLTGALLKALEPGTRIVFVGDSDQLPSVGAGNVLKDIIDSEYFQTVRLNLIHRQQEESQIVENAHRINHGEEPKLSEVRAEDFVKCLRDGELKSLIDDKGDFIFVSEHDQKNILNKIVEISREVSPEDIEILSPTKKGILGTENLNQNLQNIFNSPAEGKTEISFGSKIFRVGDKVMQNKNNYRLETLSYVDGKLATYMDPMVSFSKEEIEENDAIRRGKGVFNGEIGEITGIDAEKKALTVCYDKERFANYEYTDLDELEHAYAITIHKSQGSEFKMVLIPISWFPEKLATRSLIYTGITRAKEILCLIGDAKYLSMMVENDRHLGRNSGLKKRLMAYYM